MHFAHCDHDETYISLHDCVAERAWFENSKLGFAFKDGFYVSPDHPESNLSTMVRTDLSHAEFTLSPDEGANYDVSVCFFKETLFVGIWVLIFSAIMQAVFLIIGKWDYTVLLGNLISAAVGIFNFYLLCRTVEKALSSSMQ